MIFLSSEWNNSRYFFSSYFLIYPSILSKVIYKGFAPYEMLNATSLNKKYLYDFSSSKILLRSKSLILIMSSK